MIRITKSPAKYQGADTEPTFVIEGVDPQQEFTVDIFANNTLMGTKRFIGLETVSVNVAAVARRAIDIEPPKSVFNVESLEAHADIHIRCGGISSAAIPITLCRQKSLPVFAPLTDAPQHMAVPTCAVTSICVVATKKTWGTIYMKSPYDLMDFDLDIAQWQGEGVYSVMLDFKDAFALLEEVGVMVEDFYEAKLHIRDGSQTIERSYTFVGTQGTTLCWLNDYGAIDCYTFTTPTDYRNNTLRSTTATTSRRAITVATPLIPCEQLQWLAQIERSPKVWLRQGESWQQVEIERFSAEIKPDVCSSAQVSIFIDNPTIRRA